MPKPKTDVAGSGLHLNISMHKDGKNLFYSEDGKPSETAAYFMGGIMKHAKALCAITNPLVNSYKRLMSGYGAPRKIDWSTKGEKALLKYHMNSNDSKVELRFPDPAANPYLAIAVSIAAGLDGIRNHTEPGKKNNPECDSLPGTLKEAIAKFGKDPLMEEVLGKELLKVYKNIKYDEWSEYMLQVSDWEVSKYLIKM